MRMVSLVFAAVFLASASLGQGAPAFPQITKDSELARSLDRAITALERARQDAVNNSATALQQSLKLANEAWFACYRRYRTWPTADTGWQPDFDAVQNALLNATNALTPGNNVPECGAQLEVALETLRALRDRNGVPDLRGSAQEFRQSLAELQTTSKSLQNKRLTSSDIDSLQASFQQATNSWKEFSQALIDVNALGLGASDLNKLRQIVALVNVGFDAIDNILKNPDTRALLAQLQTTQDHFADLMNQLETRFPNLFPPQEEEQVDEAATSEKGIAGPRATRGLPGPKLPRGPRPSPFGRD